MIDDVPWNTVKVSNVPKLDGFEVREYQVVMRGKRKRKKRSERTERLAARLYRLLKF